MLTDAQLSAWKTDGTVCPLELLSRNEATELRKQFDYAIASQSPSPAILNSRVADCLSFAYIARNKLLLDYVESLLGGEINYLWTDVFYKQPHDSIISWHTGRTFFPTVKTDLAKAGQDACVTVVVALDDAYKDNGCVIVVPGTHLSTDDEVREWIGCATQRTDHKRLVFPQSICRAPIPLILRAGQMALLSERVIHGSDINSTNSVRPSISIRYCSPVVSPSPRQPTGRYECIRVR